MNDDLTNDDPLVPLPDDELDDDDAVIDPKKIVPVDPEEDHESLETLAEEEDEVDADLDEGDSF